MIDKERLFHNQFPAATYFDAEHLDELPEFLEEKGWLLGNEKVIHTEKPGEGNMNFVQRIVTDQRSFIIKQSRPWVEKFPEIKAPADRLKVEARFYQLIMRDPFFIEYSPQLFGYDPINFIICFEDLGKGSDFNFCYKKSERISVADLSSLLDYITHLHRMKWGELKKTFPSNQELRVLNHEHIFRFPYMTENGFDLDTVQEGLQALSMPVKTDEELKSKITKLGKVYLDAGPILIHGDYYPGSWLKVGNEVKVIDPEFSYFGFAEFDVGVMAAHMLMSGMETKVVGTTLKNYHPVDGFDYELFMGFCGIEMLRRIIGLAQVPLDLTLDEKDNLIKMAKDFINSPTANRLI